MPMQAQTKKEAEAAAKAALAKRREAAALEAKVEECRRDVPPGIGEVGEMARRARTVRAKLLDVQCRLRVTKDRGRGHTPNAQVTYEYRNAEDILEAAKPLCADVGAVVTVDVEPLVVGVGVPLDVREVRPAGKNSYGKPTEPVYAQVAGPRVAALATARFADVETGEEVTARAFAFVDFRRSGQTEPEKLCGSADSYASKYALGHLFAIDNNRDADMESDLRAPSAAPTTGAPAADPF